MYNHRPTLTNLVLRWLYINCYTYLFEDCGQNLKTRYWVFSLNSVRYGTQVVLPIPMVDSDGDTVRCRWATGNECVSVCNSLPLATLDSVCIHVILLSIRTLDYSGNCFYMYFRRKFVIIQASCWELIPKHLKNVLYSITNFLTQSMVLVLSTKLLFFFTWMHRSYCFIG